MKKWLSVLVASILCINLAGCNKNTTPDEPTTPETPEETTTMRVASWNIDSKAHPDIKEMSNILNEHNIDIMGFQEIDINNSRNDYDMAADFVNENYPYVHFAKGRDFADGYFGVGTTSKYDFKEISSIPIESTGSKATKTLERIVIEVDGKEIAWYVTHTSWENTELRRRQFTEIYERIMSDTTPYKILVADFNADQSLYEYDLFKDNFNVANGLNGVWFDSFNGTDDTMKVMTVDNIIVSKNINITNVESYHSDMADHDMIFADIELLDEEAPIIEHDRALGMGVTASSTIDESHPYNTVDFDDATVWQSNADTNQEIILTLDRPYLAKTFNIVWGENVATKYHVETSIDGVNYTLLAEGNETHSFDINNEVQFVKVVMEGKEAEEGYQISSLELFGDWITPTVENDANLLTNGDMENQDGWSFEDATVESNATYEFNYDNSMAVITKTGAEEAGDGYIIQNVAVNPNERYQLSFEHKTDTLNSASFTYEVTQKDSEGNVIKTHQAKLTDNLNMSIDTFRRFDYNFTTAPNAASVDVALHVVAGEGSLWIDNVHVKEVIPTESVFLSADKTTLKVGETAKLTANILPTTSNDIHMNWISNDENIVTIDENGVVTAKTTGTAYVGLLSDSDLLAESYIQIIVE